MTSSYDYPNISGQYPLFSSHHIPISRCFQTSKIHGSMILICLNQLCVVLLVVWLAILMLRSYRFLQLYVLSFVYFILWITAGFWLAIHNYFYCIFICDTAYSDARDAIHMLIRKIASRNLILCSPVNIRCLICRHGFSPQGNTSGKPLLQ